MKNISIAIVFFVFIVNSSMTAQVTGVYDEDGKWLYGVKAGAALSSIDGIRTTLIREWYPDSTYSSGKEWRWGATGGLFFYHRFKNSAVAIQPEVTYAMQGSHFRYSDSILLSPIDTVGLNYLMKFRYQYINLLAFAKIYPFYLMDNFLEAVNVGIGLQVGVNVSSENIAYQSNKPYLGPDLQIQQNLRGVLKGKTDVSVVFGLAGELKGKTPLSFEGRANIGMVDAIETLANGYNFIENRTPSVSFQLTIGYAFSID